MTTSAFPLTHRVALSRRRRTCAYVHATSKLKHLRAPFHSRPPQMAAVAALGGARSAVSKVGVVGRRREALRRNPQNAPKPPAPVRRTPVSHSVKPGVYLQIKSVKLTLSSTPPSQGRRAVDGARRDGRESSCDSNAWWSSPRPHHRVLGG